MHLLLAKIVYNLIKGEVPYMQHLCRILIIDDESILRNGLKHLCNWEEEQFCIVGEASNGKQALQMIEKAKPHIIITDVVMPVMDGVEFSKIIHNLYPDIKIIVLSSFSEFNYLKETFKHGVCDYLLKAKLTSDDLLEVLKKARSQTIWKSPENTQLKPIVDINDALSKLINGHPLAQTTEVTAINNYFTNKNFLILECSLDFLDYNNDISRDRFKKSIFNLSNHHLSTYIYSNIFSQNKYIIIINFTNDEDLDKNIDEFTRNLKISFNFTTFITSNQFKGIENIPKIHNRIAALLPKTFYFHNYHLLSANTLLKSRNLSPFDFNLFKVHIENLKFQSAYKIVETYFNHVKSSLALDDYSLKRFCQNIIYTTLNICDELGFDVSEINKSKIRLFKTIDLATSFHSLEKIFFNILKTISSSIDLQAEQRNYIIINQIKQYVNENYNNEISLTDIADKLHINYYYMSSYFKTHTNENLSTYINKVRIEKAKNLLSDKTIPISHISEMVGFSEHNYFSKVFKKYTTFTPTAYRRKVVK